MKARIAQSVGVSCRVAVVLPYWAGSFRERDTTVRPLFRWDRDKLVKELLRSMPAERLSAAVRSVTDSGAVGCTGKGNALGVVAEALGLYCTELDGVGTVLRAAKGDTLPPMENSKSTADRLADQLQGLSDEDCVALLFARYYDWVMGHPGGISSDLLLGLPLSDERHRRLLQAMDDLHTVLNPAVCAGGLGAKPPRRPKVT